MAKRKLIVIATRCGAALYEHTPKKRGFTLIREISNPEGRLRDREITSDRNGRANNPGRGIGIGSNYSNEHTPAETIVRSFVRELASELESEAYHNSWDDFIVVAEPRLLGMIKGELGTNASSKISHFVQKDLGKVSNHDLVEHLAEVI